MVKRNLGRSLLGEPLPPAGGVPSTGGGIPPGASEPPAGTLPSHPEGGFVPVPTGPGTPALPGDVSALTTQLMKQAAFLGRQPADMAKANLMAMEPIEGTYRSDVNELSKPVDFTNWDELTRFLNETDKAILSQATVNADLSQITTEELDLRLRQIGLNEKEANNLLSQIGLREEGLGIAGQRLDLAELGINESIDYLNQTLTDVDFDEDSLTRNLATIADQISMTDLQSQEVGYQRGDLSSLDDITTGLLTARETLLGEETDIGGQRIDIERERLGLEEESTELQADRAMKAALRDSYARGASFTTGIREDVSDLNQARGLALDELALRNTGLDLSDRELLATSGYQSAEIDAARNRAEIDLDQNMRALDLDESELEFLAERLGRSSLDVVDAITRLDTNRMAIQLDISQQANALISLGLDRDEIANQLLSLGYDRADVGLTLESYALQRGSLGLEGRRLAADDTLKQLAIERAQREVDQTRLGYQQRQDEFDHTYQQWSDLRDATERYESAKTLQAAEFFDAQAGLGATQEMADAIQEWAPVLSGITRGELDQLSGLSGQIQGLTELEGFPGLNVPSTGAASEPEMILGPPSGGWDPTINPPAPDLPYDPDRPFPDDFLPDDDPPSEGDEEEEPFDPKLDPPAPPRFDPPPPAPAPVPDFDPEAFAGFDFGAAFEGLFNVGIDGWGYTMDPGQRRTTSERDLGNQLSHPSDFSTALLNELGAPVRANNLETLDSWMAAEGTTAGFNPLATTKQGGNPGDANRDQYGQFNSVGVKNYPDFATGVDRTAATLRDSFALPLLEGLMANIPASVMNTDHLVNEALSTWSGGGYTEFPNVATPGPRYGPPR